MFKKNQYIIFTEGYKPNDLSFPINFCFKQRMDGDALYPYLDCKGSRTNGWDKPRAFKKDHPGFESDWRYATLKEIEEYDRIGKPYDVTTLPKFVLPEKWCVKDTCSEESNELYEYANIYGAIPPYKAVKGVTYYFHFPQSDGCTTSDQIEKDYIEITLAQFKTYVLGIIESSKNYNYDYLIPILEKLNIT